MYGIWEKHGHVNVAYDRKFRQEFILAIFNAFKYLYLKVL